MSGSATPPTVVAGRVEAMRALAGAHPRLRPVHAKGIVCSGTFRASPDARRVSGASPLQGHAVPTVIRFVNPRGNPDAPDGLPGPRSLSGNFQLPAGKSADILASSIGHRRKGD